jgi:hypothetical protein
MAHIYANEAHLPKQGGNECRLHRYWPRDNYIDIYHVYSRPKSMNLALTDKYISNN